MAEYEFERSESTAIADVRLRPSPVHSDESTALMIVPTFNESTNIERLLDELFSLETYEKTGWNLHVMVRDDRSPDGTGQIVQELAGGRYAGRLILSEGDKNGLGSALRLAFSEGIERNYPVILTMDADFSHTPDDVIHLLSAITGGADVAVGSRYVDGGLIPGNWPIRNIIRTRVATQVARVLGGVNPALKELTTNFRAIRREVLQEIPFERTQVNGFGFQIFFANAISGGNYKVQEVPISFHTRANGVSKARFADVIEFFKVAYTLNDDSPAKQLARFMIVGLTGTIVNLASFWLLRQALNGPTAVLSLLAIQLSIVWNFCWHTQYTFRRHSAGSSFAELARAFARYEGVTAFTQTTIFVIFVAFYHLNMFYLIAQFLGICGAFFVNYYLSNRYIWSVERVYERR